MVSLIVASLFSVVFVLASRSDDTLVPFANLPNYGSNPYVMNYTAPVPSLQPSGNHEGGAVLCLFATLTAFLGKAELTSMSVVTDTSLCYYEVSSPTTTGVPTTIPPVSTPTTGAPTTIAPVSTPTTTSAASTLFVDSKVDMVFGTTAAAVAYWLLFV